MAKKAQQVSKATATASKTAGSLIIEQPKRARLGLEIVGTADLIQNRFPQKAFEQMLRKHMGLSTHREAKKPRDLIASATILNTAGRVCIPPQAIKAGMLLVASKDETLKKFGRMIRTYIYIEGSSIPIDFEAMIPRVDMVRNSGINRVPEERFRPSFHNWKARLTIQYDESKIRPQTIVNLLFGAGDVGVGEWRPQNNGTFGTFTVSRSIESAKELAEVRALCAPAIQSLVVPEWALDADIDADVLARIMAGENVSSDCEEAAE